MFYIPWLGIFGDIDGALTSVENVRSLAFSLQKNCNVNVSDNLRCPDWGSVSTLQYKKHGRLIPTAKRGKEIKKTVKLTQLKYITTVTTVRRRNLKTGSVISAWLCLPSALIRHKNAAFRQLFKPEEFEKASFSFSRGGKAFLINFSKTMPPQVIMGFPWLSFPRTRLNPKWSVIGTLQNSLGAVWWESIWCIFRVNCFVFKFLRAVWTGPER